jgi:hypothetical protein
MVYIQLSQCGKGSCLPRSSATADTAGLHYTPTSNPNHLILICTKVYSNSTHNQSINQASAAATDRIHSNANFLTKKKPYQGFVLLEFLFSKRARTWYLGTGANMISTRVLIALLPSRYAARSSLLVPTGNGQCELLRTKGCRAQYVRSELLRQL